LPTPEQPAPRWYGTDGRSVSVSGSGRQRLKIVAVEGGREVALRLIDDVATTGRFAAWTLSVEGALTLCAGLAAMCDEALS
jgi:hypothetical protein